VAAGLWKSDSVIGRVYKDGCPRPAFVDYKDVPTLKKLCNVQGKMMSRKRTGSCAAFQRATKDAVKRARFMALLPYAGE
jgi:small subunit ribosomal protein S18